MQTMRDYIEYVLDESLEYLEKRGHLPLKERAYIKNKMMTKFLASRHIKDIKGKIINGPKKLKLERPVIISALTVTEIRLSQIICDVHCVSFNDIYSRSRKRDVVDARMQLVSFMYIYMGYTFSQIGKLFSRDHSTIIHNLQANENLLFASGVFCNKYNLFIETAKRELPEIFNDLEKNKEKLREYEKVKNQRTLLGYRKVIQESKKLNNDLHTIATVG